MQRSKEKKNVLLQEPVGDVYQDEESEAALLIHTDNDDGSLLIVSIMKTNKRS